MKIHFDKKKSAETWVAITQNTAEISKKVALGVKSGTETVVEKTKESAAVVMEKSRNDAYARRLKKYNPLFPEQYHDASFNIPNIVIIVDDAERKGIDVCEGAIGWLKKEKDVEILFLYDEAVPFSGLQFVPAATCDAVYYMDSFDRSVFIKTDNYFEKIQEERTAELEHIARCLGAKRCYVNITEKEKTEQSKKKKAEMSESIKGTDTTGSAEQSLYEKSAKETNHINYTTFEGNNVVQKPTLKWFAHDSRILELISARIGGENSVVSKDIKFHGSSFKTMSQKAACAIDSAVVGMGGAKGKTAIEAQATKELESILVFHVEF